MSEKCEVTRKMRKKMKKNNSTHQMAAGNDQAVRRFAI